MRVRRSHQAVLDETVRFLELRLNELTRVQERLQAYHVALNAAVTCLEDMIETTRPLRLCGCASRSADNPEEEIFHHWTDQQKQLHHARSRLADSSNAPGSSGSGGASAQCNNRYIFLSERSGKLLEPSSGASVGALPAWAQYMGLDDAPEKVLLRHHHCTPAEFAGQVRSFVLECAIDVVKLRFADAEDEAAEVRGRLVKGLQRFTALCAVVLIAKPELLHFTALYRLDSCAPYAEAPPPVDFWARVVRQARLTRFQELAMAELLQLYKKRLGVLLTRREQLLQELVEHGDDSDVQEDLTFELGALQTECSFTGVAFAQALYSRVMEPHQGVCMWVAAYPYTPQLMVLAQGLEEILRVRAQAAGGQR